MTTDSALLMRMTEYRADLLRYCLALTGSRWDAEDLAQDALEKITSIMIQIASTQLFLHLRKS